MVQFSNMQRGYTKMWNDAEVVADKHAAARAMADKLLKDKARYKAVGDAIGVPWHIVGGYNLRESDCNFNTHLHCGDPLKARTVHEPKGRPKAAPKSGHLPYTWEESAIDALTMPGKEYQKITRWSVERSLFQGECYNGLGYITKDDNTPYLWSWTNEYHGGKFVADHVYSKTAWDQQPGLVAVWKALIEKGDPDVIRWSKDREVSPPSGLTKSVTDAATTQEKRVRNVGLGAGAAGTTVSVTDDAAAPVIHPMINYTLVGVGVAVAVVAAFIISRKAKAAKDLVKAKWGGEL